MHHRANLRVAMVQCCASAMVSVFAVCSAAADPTAFDLEPNQPFANRQTISPGFTGPGTIEVAGSLEPLQLEPDLVADGALSTRQPVQSHNFFDLPAGAAYFAYTDNTTGVDTPDIIMQAVDSIGNQIAVDDDSSPLGNGLAAALTSTVNTDGTIHLQVSGFSDFDFTGDHSQFGDYTLFVSFGERPLGDIDFYEFTGLVPLSTFVAEVTFADFDTILHSLNEDGSLFDTDDDGGEGVLSRLGGIVPSSGVVNLAVTGYSDFDGVGEHSRSGAYTVALTVIPEPAAGALVALGLAGVVWLRSRCSRRQEC